MTAWFAPRGFRTLWIAVGWALLALLVYLSLTPRPPAPLDFNLSDKLAHTLFYGLLMGWFMPLWPAHAWRLLALGLLGIGVGLELLQGCCTEARQFEFTDMIADGLGVALAWAALRGPLAPLRRGIARCLTCD